MTREDINNHLLNDPIYDYILKKYISNVEDRNEFRQELWVILMNIDEEKIISLYNKKELKYFYIGIIRNQVISKSSPWYKNYIKYKNMDFFFYDYCYDNQDDSYKRIDFIDNLYITWESEDKKLKENRIDYIEQKLLEIVLYDPKLLRDVTVFKMHFYDGLTYRVISDKTNIKLTNVFLYINNILNILKINKPNDDI